MHPEALGARAIALALGMSAALALLLASSPARAEARLGLDLDYAKAIKGRGVDHGFGFAAHLGAQAHMPLLAAVSEFVFTYDGFEHSFGPNVYRGLLGFRLGVGEILRPSIFAHMGLGFLHVDDHTRSAFSYDAGLALDLTVLPVIDVGLHAGFNQVVGGSTSSPFQWLTLGAEAALVF